MGTGYTDYWGSMWDSKWEWSSKFSYFPRRLDSGQWSWFKEYYLGQREVHGPGEPVILRKYLTPEEFTWKALQES